MFDSSSRARYPFNKEEMQLRSGKSLPVKNVADRLVYEIVSESSLYSYIGHTTEPNEVFLKSDQVLKPLFGFYGTCDECDKTIARYIRNYLQTSIMDDCTHAPPGHKVIMN